MRARQHEPVRSLGAYVLTALDPQEVRAVEGHLAVCPRCRAELAQLRNAYATLAGIPPEALLDGPPADGDLVLQRTLRRVRAERDGGTRRRVAVIGIAAAVAGAALAGGGVLVGWGAAPNVVAEQQVPQGTRTVSATDEGTGAGMTVAVEPAAGWVRLDALVDGAPPGRECLLVAVGKDGSRAEAGSWRVPENGESGGTRLQGAVALAPEDLAAVTVETDDGERLVSVQFS